MEVNPKEYLGAFSPSAAEKHGSSIYATPDGREVETTCVGDLTNYKWPDAIVIGPVTKWLRVGQPRPSRVGE